MGRLALIAALFVGCFTATPPDCIVQCGDEGQCPGGMSCLEDGFCHQAGTSLCRPVEATPDGGETDAGAVEVWKPSCSGGWCRLQPPYEGQPVAVLEALPGKFLAASDGVYRWLSGGWVRVLDVNSPRFLAGRSPSDLRVFTNTQQHRFDGRTWTTETLTFMPRTVGQFGNETLVATANGMIFSSTGGPFRQEAALFSQSPIWSTGRPFLTDGVRIAARDSTSWSNNRVSVPFSPRSAAALTNTLFLFGPEGTFTVPTSFLSSLEIPLTNQTQGALAGAVVGQTVFGITRTHLVEVKEGSRGELAPLPDQLRVDLASLFSLPDGGPPLGAFGGSSGSLWVSFNSRLWELTPSGGTSRGSVSNQPVVGGFEDERSTSFVAEGRVFDIELGLAAVQPDSPSSITQLLPFEGRQAALTSTGLFLQGDAGWYLELPGDLVSGSANAGRLVARMRDGGVLLYSEGIPRVLEMPVPAVSVAVTQGGRIFAASDAGDLFVEDGGLFSEATVRLGARNLVPAPGDDLAYLKGLQLCWLDANTCVPGVPVSQLRPLTTGAFAVLGSLPRAYVVTSPTSFEMVRLPLTPVSIWSGRDGGLFVGGAEGRVFQAQ